MAVFFEMMDLTAGRLAITLYLNLFEEDKASLKENAD